MSRQVIVMGTAGHYLHWGWFGIGLANLLIIVAMLVLFVLALVVPFGRHRAQPEDGGH